MKSVSEGTLVSIITPAYNTEDFIAETYASIKAQTYQYWEWIIVDDQSTDRTALLVGAFAEEEPRVHVIRINEKERSAAHARNVAMKTARGEVFAFLDADDLWEPEKTEKQIHYMGDHPEADGVCSWYRIFGEASRVRNDHRMMRTARICQRSELLQGCPIFTSSLMMRRRCFEEIGDMNGRSKAAIRSGL